MNPAAQKNVSDVPSQRTDDSLESGGQQPGDRLRLSVGMSFSSFAEFHLALDELKKENHPLQTGTVTTVPFASSCVMFHIVLLVVLVNIIIVHFSR